MKEKINKNDEILQQTKQELTVVGAVEVASVKAETETEEEYALNEFQRLCEVGIVVWDIDVDGNVIVLINDKVNVETPDKIVIPSKYKSKKDGSIFTPEYIYVTQFSDNVKHLKLPNNLLHLSIGEYSKEGSIDKPPMQLAIIEFESIKKTTSIWLNKGLPLGTKIKVNDNVTEVARNNIPNNVLEIVNENTIITTDLRDNSTTLLATSVPPNEIPKETWDSINVIRKYVFTEIPISSTELVLPKDLEEIQPYAFEAVRKKDNGEYIHSFTTLIFPENENKEKANLSVEIWKGNFARGTGTTKQMIKKINFGRTLNATSKDDFSFREPLDEVTFEYIKNSSDIKVTDISHFRELLHNGAHKIKFPHVKDTYDWHLGLFGVNRERKNNTKESS